MTISLYRFMRLAPLFCAACIGLTFLVLKHSAWLGWLNDPRLLYSGLILVAASLLTILVRQQLTPQTEDLFFLGTLVVWYVQWRTVYRIDAPVFLWYPCFLALFTLWLNVQVVNQSALLDNQHRETLQLIHTAWFFHPSLLASLIVLSIYFSDYFIFYPIAMAVALIHCSFGMVLQECKRQ